MAYREVTRVDIQEIIRRWQAGEGYRRVASGTGLSRNTVRKYLSAGKAEGIARDGAVPSDDQLSRLAVMGQPGPRQAETPSGDLLAPWGDQIYRWLTGERLQLTRNHELLLGRGCQVSYQSLRRFVQKRNWRRRSKTTVRMEDTPPGEVVEVDFGRLGLIHDRTRAGAAPCGP
jgi:transposase